ncbi:MAG: hypothetical protein B7Y49_13850 [Sphingomonas sp. 28-62-11]|nr:MAG: hypothetical protein B7Y49_13850 [Sphingomonas sp. 28-62-11]
MRGRAILADFHPLIAQDVDEGAVTEIESAGTVHFPDDDVDQETGAELEDNRPAREPHEDGDHPRGVRGPRRHGDGGRGEGRGDRGPRPERSAD